MNTRVPNNFVIPTWHLCQPNIVSFMGCTFIKLVQSRNQCCLVLWFFKEPLVPGISKTQSRRSTGSRCLKNNRIKELPVLCVSIPLKNRQFSWKTSRFLSRLFPGSLNLVIFSQAVARVGTRKILFDESVGGWLFLNLASVGYMSKNRHWIQEPPNTGTNKSCNTLSFQCSH
jgi:hypothetical protein